MVGIVIVTHGDMAKGIETSVNLIIGQQKQFKTLGLYEGNDFEEFRINIKKSVEEVNDGGGVMILVDLFGASPYNSVAYNFSEFIRNNIPVHLVTGVNLPMLIEVLMERENIISVDELYPIALQAGKEGIKDALEELVKEGVSL